MGASGIIFSNLNDNTLSRLTSDRTVAAIPFGCRYRLVDFALSNMVNAEISDIALIANYNYRSLTEHIGAGKDWDLARRAGGIKFISPYQTSRNSNTQMYSHRLEALISMLDFIREYSEENVVLSDCDNICNIDLNTVIEQHDQSGADMTAVVCDCPPSFTSKTKQLMFRADEHGRVIDAAKSDKHLEGYDRCINLFIFKTSYLLNMVEDAITHQYHSMSDDILIPRHSKYNYRVYRFTGYVAPVSSFTDYYTQSMRLNSDRAVRDQLLGVKNRPIYTKVHNSPPTYYANGCVVRDSAIADGCHIEGTVENCILFRGVKVGRGSVVRDSILFAGTTVGTDCTVECVVADKNVTITDRSHLAGKQNIPFFIPKGRQV